MYVNFVKSTMMKGMIESKAVEETKAYFVKMTEEAKKYFKNLEKARKPEVQHKGAPNQVNQASN
jgi:DNA-binding MarR family transcriptional regulator